MNVIIRLLRFFRKKYFNTLDTRLIYMYPKTGFRILSEISILQLQDYILDDIYYPVLTEEFNSFEQFINVTNQYLKPSCSMYLNNMKEYPDIYFVNLHPRSLNHMWVSDKILPEPIYHMGSIIPFK